LFSGMRFGRFEGDTTKVSSVVSQLLMSVL